MHQFVVRFLSLLNAATEIINNMLLEIKSTLLITIKYISTWFVIAPLEKQSSIFSFEAYIAGLVFLCFIYTTTDIKYRFRISIAPLPLWKFTYYSLVFVGFGTLFTSLFFSQRWPIPFFFANQAMWQTAFGIIILILILILLRYAYIKPPIYNARNCKKFAQELFNISLKGSDNELPTIMHELAKSAPSLIKFSRTHSSLMLATVLKGANSPIEIQRSPTVENCAYDILLLIGNRKLCRHIVASSPATAIAFFEAMSVNKKYDLPIKQFVQNISAEALINKDSLLYHEDEGYNSGLIGYIKPFSQAVYGNYQLVEALAANYSSPLDIPSEIFSSDAPMLDAYCRATLITLGSYLDNKPYAPSSALCRAIENIKNTCLYIHKIDTTIGEYYSTDLYKRFKVTISFVTKATKLLNQKKSFPKIWRLHTANKYINIYDDIAQLMLEIIYSSSSVRSTPGTFWDINFGTVWNNFLPFNNNDNAWKILHFKLRRLIYNEIRLLEKSPNYKSAYILGFCLNVMGLEIKNATGRENFYQALHKIIIAWVVNNFLKLRSSCPDIANACLIGRISFDETKKRLVKTYMKGLDSVAPKEHLKLKK